MKTMRSRGFTLIELLVVIAIIGILSSVVLASLSSSRNRAKTASRASDLHNLQQALEIMAVGSRGQYPNPGWAWRSQCVAWGGYAGDQVIPGLVPTYYSQMPADPDMNASANLCCYLYLSDGVNYKILDHNCPTLPYQQMPRFIDPRRDGGSASPPGVCTIDANAPWSWAISSNNTPYGPQGDPACW